MKKGKKKIWTTMKRVKCVHLFAHEAIVSCYLSSSNCFLLFLWKKKEQKCFCFHWWKIYSFCFWSLSWKRKDKVLHRIIVIRIYFVCKTALYHNSLILQLGISINYTYCKTLILWLVSYFVVFTTIIQSVETSNFVQRSIIISSGFGSFSDCNYGNQTLVLLTKSGVNHHLI
jgi:hypothetical protein